jgi:hypothetical protein
VDGCITKAPCGGEVAGPSPVDRRKQGLKRSILTDADGIPLGAVPAAANCRDDGLLAATLDTRVVVGATCPAGGAPGCRLRLPALPAGAGRTWHGRRDRHAGVPAPIQASRRWPVERTHAWGNQYGKLRWCTERRRLVVVGFWLALANAAIVCGRLVRRAWTCYRWDSRPGRRP